MAFDIDEHMPELEQRFALGKCEVSGIDLCHARKREWNSASLDRIDSRGGYTYDNVRIIALSLNIAFNNWGEEKFAGIAAAWLEMRRRRAIPMLKLIVSNF